MKLFDTLSGKKKLFKARHPKRVDLFVCGPTVYDAAHIGHARTYIVFDSFVKYLRHQKFDVRYVQNITDVDDKIIARANEQNVPWRKLAQAWKRSYRADMKALGITAVTKYARATTHIPQIISQIQTLLRRGYAYRAQDGVYYDVKKFKEYGKLSHRTVQQAEDAVSRIDESISKRNKGDFALWKLSKPEEPRWKSPWGWGRPGWHIEDTAITEHIFGAQYDVHGGARDLIFPHHEAEIAQMEAASGKNPLVRFWMHTGFLTVGGEKMSKSLKNFITIQELLAKHNACDFRLFALLRHYRSPISYEEKYLEEAYVLRMRMEEFARRLISGEPVGIAKVRLWQTSPKSDFGKHLGEYEKIFRQKLADDFNTPEAFATLFELVNAGNKALDANALMLADAKKIVSFLQDVNRVFGILESSAFHAQKFPVAIQKLVAEREKMRKQRRWEEADKLRGEIAALGYEVEDAPLGPRIKNKPRAKAPGVLQNY